LTERLGYTGLFLQYWLSFITYLSVFDLGDEKVRLKLWNGFAFAMASSDFIFYLNNKALLWLI
jgi:hypothetical protein